MSNNESIKELETLSKKLREELENETSIALTYFSCMSPEEQKSLFDYCGQLQNSIEDISKFLDNSNYKSKE